MNIAKYGTITVFWNHKAVLSLKKNREYLFFHSPETLHIIILEQKLRDNQNPVTILTLIWKEVPN